MATLVHVTHEAVQQAGGIGTVLRGLITARSYRAHCQRTILLGPLTDPDSTQPLGPDGEILYDASRSIRTAAVADQLSAVERKFGVRLVYGRRLLTQDGRRASPEVLLVDVSHPPERLNEFKRDLFLQFGLESQPLRTALGIRAIPALGRAGFRGRALPSRGRALLAAGT